jgi:hypothetical protein
MYTYKGSKSRGTERRWLLLYVYEYTYIFIYIHIYIGAQSRVTERRGLLWSA